mmetsp:Transcript_27304/g.70860  ORF Transcript_27304/g.70860 Transcript_27304/m.70860 type:complete len:119 (-) Transcript_27304:21-377(-)
MQIFKVRALPGTYPLPYVVMEDEGMVGHYNRANRSMQHFNENVAGFVLNAFLAGQVFAFPVMMLTLVFVGARVLHQTAYTESGYGAHAPGNLLGVLVAVTLEMLVLLIALGGLADWTF